jgi:hypothetical protein
MLKELNEKSIQKSEDLKSQMSALKKQHAQELIEKVTKASGKTVEVEAEI